MAPRKTAKQHTGERGEQIAAAFLRQRGFRIIATNYRTGNGDMRGDIDIIAAGAAPAGESIRFVEVRTRRTGSYGTPEESLTAAKQRRMAALAEYYLHIEAPGAYTQAQIDVVVLVLAANGAVERIEHIENAVEGG